VNFKNLPINISKSELKIKLWFLLLHLDLIYPRFCERLSLEIDQVTVALEGLA
jgi:hypothetical protein